MRQLPATSKPTPSRTRPARHRRHHREGHRPRRDRRLGRHVHPRPRHRRRSRRPGASRPPTRSSSSSATTDGCNELLRLRNHPDTHDQRSRSATTAAPACAATTSNNTNERGPGAPPSTGQCRSSQRPGQSDARSARHVSKHSATQRQASDEGRSDGVPRRGMPAWCATARTGIDGRCSRVVFVHCRVGGTLKGGRRCAIRRRPRTRRARCSRSPRTGAPDQLRCSPCGQRRPR